jgi:nitrogen regulatory protein PII
MKLITAIIRPEKLDEILDVLVLDGNAETLAEAIGKHARTGTIGDGKLWVTTVDVLDELFGAIRRRVSIWSARCCATGRIVRIDK